MDDEKAMLLGLFKSVYGYVSDSPEVVYLWRIRHGCDIESEKSVQLSEKVEDKTFHIARKN
ncbi:hypothetical protein H5410_000817 [Solanum commersonii]|uniref:Uncharacterized protein n=1 Tax=Solanum commersonii TaxID=4109 RepID=A0A9J6AXB1_SOLCO|nr:hypothetical protein H5410_000817 [Solanum commersonii]